MYNYFINFITLAYFINNVEAISNFAKTGMLPVKMFGVCPVDTYKELGTTGIPSGMGH
jgi:hypothetical protein